MDFHPARLYRNSAPEATVAERLRAAFLEGDYEHLQTLLDEATATTTLCCVNPTSALLALVVDALRDLPRPGTVLSIGSGSGLLEFLLDARLGDDGLDVHGVDIAPINAFAPFFDVVQEDLRPSLQGVTVLLAVYLRRPSLLLTYLNWFPHVHKLVLIGPKNEDPIADATTAAGVGAWGALEVRVMNHTALAPWDMLQVWARHTT
ncbi:hypothetical protein ACHHYP_14645 [Achlya hypogyna]|uniref:DOT1 domain-containing protein n=1 Tax=Achlya hypogyna TaxID=1202772 RepID=A0A1V9YCN6_ACHHY|nr:hypothetical protein ACHHYP_14645 [Achlya hypogyna]